jgi:hypothetical protein
VLRDADTAMYDAQHSDNRTAVFCESMRLRLTPATAERRPHRALDDGEFPLLHQPIVALARTPAPAVEEAAPVVLPKLRQTTADDPD